jgi:hypothetical protein
MLTKVLLSGLYVKFGNVNRKKKILKIDTRNPLDSMFRKKEYGDIFWNDKEKKIDKNLLLGKALSTYCNSQCSV